MLPDSGREIVVELVVNELVVNERGDRTVSGVIQ